MLFDCISLIDDAAVRVVAALGGLSAIAISHPHYYSSMVEWSRAFGGVPIWLHADDRQWVMRPDPAIRFWEGEEQRLGPGLTLLRLGGHFAGAQVLHWAGGADGRGAVLAGDVLQVVMDRRFVSFMYSYPNYTPLPAATVQRIVRTARALPVRAHLWRLVRRRGPRGRQGSAPPLGRALRAGAAERREQLGQWSSPACAR